MTSDELPRRASSRIASARGGTSRRVQADRRLVEHEQRAGERGAERRGERHALRLAAGERARLPIEGEVAEPDRTRYASRADQLSPRELALPGGACASDVEARARLGELQPVPGGEIEPADAVRAARRR